VETRTSPVTELRRLLTKVTDLQYAAGVLAWDQETYMPAGGVQARARQLSTLSRMAHELFTAESTGELLGRAEAATADDPFESDDRSLVRVARRDYEEATRLPADLVAQLAEASATARPVWIKARAEDDWAAFSPALENNVRLHREVTDALGWETRRYDALVHSNEPGLTTADLERLFEQLKAAVVPLVAQIGQPGADDELLHRPIAPEKQLQFAFDTCVEFGFNRENGRQDLSAHPFCTMFSVRDVRITTRTTHGFGHTLYSSMHETGHGLYNQGIAPALDGTPLAYGATSGFHESQSRLWENLVGRSRPFAEWIVPRLRQAFPDEYGGLEPEEWYRAVNLVRPSLIRVDADEVTYNLHILLRFELENLMLDGALAPADVPEAWNELAQDYLGITPPNVADGPLQDIHWSGFSFGGFPSYTLGNVIGAQLMEVIRRDLPDLDAQIARGEFAPLLSWLQEKIYRHGRKFTPGELLERVVGEGLNARAWIDYVTAKFTAT
jgi:carboxypeptidase Taq